MHMDPMMPHAVGCIFLILIIGIILKILRQPSVVAYLLAGVSIGPWGIDIFNASVDIERFGAIGVVLLLFFVGMKTDVKRFISNWKLAIFGTLLQILLSIGCIYIIGLFFDWSNSRIILIGFVISISSTAVVIKLLQDSQTLGSKVGQAALSILLAQDLAIVPMLIALSFLSDGHVDNHQLIKQGIGTICIIGLFAFILTRKKLNLPMGKWIKEDHELQLFFSLSICFGLALITGWLELSTALGAFLAGVLIGTAKETQWVHHTLESFKVLFIALFFVSIGMLLDINFLRENLPQTIALVSATLITNTFINAFVLRLSKFNLKESLYIGVLLSQIGEFSFVLAAVGFQAGIINERGYQFAICVIAMSLLISPLWIGSGKKLIKWQEQTSG